MTASSKEQQENLFENLKILATSIEVLNKQIQSLPDPQANSQMVDKIGLSFEGLKVINNKLNQNESYMRTNFISISQGIQNLEQKTKQLSKTSGGGNNELLREFIETYNQDINSIKSELLKNSEVIELLKITVKLLHETLNILIDEKKNN